jgi:hypothetical protein
MQKKRFRPGSGCGNGETPFPPASTTEHLFTRAAQEGGYLSGLDHGRAVLALAT